MGHGKVGEVDKKKRYCMMRWGQGEKLVRAMGRGQKAHWLGEETKLYIASPQKVTPAATLRGHFHWFLYTGCRHICSCAEPKTEPA